jgi:hypothetical protein
MNSESKLLMIETRREHSMICNNSESKWECGRRKPLEHVLTEWWLQLWNTLKENSLDATIQSLGDFTVGSSRNNFEEEET